MAADRKQVNHTIYDNMEFPEYEHREFPMAVPVNDAGELQPTPYDGKNKAHPVVIVNSQEELDALRGPEVKLVPINPDAVESAMRVEGEEDIRRELYRQADQAGVKIDKRWSVEKIEGVLQAAHEGKEVV